MGYRHCVGWSVLGTVLLATACGGETGTSEVPESASVPVVPVVQTSAGQLEGGRGSGGIGVPLGIAFAEPPVGELRWRPPAPVESWEGTKTATQFGPACWQARNPR